MKINLKAKSKIIRTASIVLLVLWVVYAWVRYFASLIISWGADKVCHKNKCFIVEISNTEAERHLWLMNRKSMKYNHGMLFVFTWEEKKYTFWMKNTLIPLDMIRVNSWMNIVDIQTAMPCTSNVCETYTPQWNATYVLEINAWLAEKYHINIWDKLYTIYQK